MTGNNIPGAIGLSASPNNEAGILILFFGIPCAFFLLIRAIRRFIFPNESFGFITYLLFNILLIGLFVFGITSTDELIALYMLFVGGIMRLLLMTINIFSLIVGFVKKIKGDTISAIKYFSYAVNLMTIAYLVFLFFLRKTRM